MSGMYSKRVSTRVFTIEESSVSLSSTQTSDRNTTSFRHFDISPFALRLGNDIHQRTSQTSNVFKTTKSSLLTNNNQNTGNVWQHTRMSVDYNGLDKSRSSSASPSTLNGRERLAKSTAPLKSAYSGNLHKSKPGKARKVSARKKAGKGKRSKQNSTKLTVAKVLLSDIVPIISAAKITSNKKKKRVSLEKLGKQKSVCNKEKLSTNKISFSSSVKSTRSNNSLFSYKNDENSGIGHHLKASELFIIKNNMQKSSKVSTVASKSANIDGLEYSMVFENNSSNFPPDASFRNLSTQKTSAQIEASGKVEVANNNPKLNKTVKKINIKNLKQSKSNQCKKSNLVSKTYKKEISKFSSSKTLVHGKTARKCVNSKNSSEGLQVHRSNFGKDKAEATEISQLRKSKIRKQGVIDERYKSSVKQAGNKSRQIKTAGNNQADKIEKISSSKFQVKNKSKKSSPRSPSVKVGKNLTTKSAKIVENKSRALCPPRPPKNAAEMSYTKKPRMSDTQAPKEILKPSIQRKKKSLNVVKTATNKSIITRSNTSRQSSKPIYLSHKITNRSDKNKLLALRKTAKLSVAKKSQKQNNKQKNLRNKKHTEPTQPKKSPKEMCVDIQRKSFSLFLSPAQSASSQSFAKFMESDSSLNETTHASSTAVKKSAKKLSSSSIRKRVNKLSTKKRKKKYMTLARQKPSRLSDALRLKKSYESVATYTIVQWPPIHGVADLVHMQKSVNIPSPKRRFALTTMEEKKKSHSKIGKVTPKQSISRKKLKSSSETLSCKKSSRSVRSRKRLLPYTTEITPKQSISKLQNISVTNLLSRTRKQTKLFHFQKESTSVGSLSQNKSSSSSACKIPSHPIARLRTKSVASEPSLHVAISRSEVNTMNIAALPAKKGVKKLSTVTRQKKSQTTVKKQTRISNNRVKGLKSVLPAAKKGNRKSLARVKQDFVHKKNMNLSKSIYSNKSTSLSNTTSLNHSNRKKSDLTSKKMILTESNFLMKDSSLPRTRTLNVRKYSLSVPGQSKQNASGMDRNIDSKSPRNSHIELTNCKKISPKKSSNRNSKVRVNKPFLSAPKRPKRTRGSYSENNNLFCTEDKNTLKPLLVKKQLQTIISPVSSNRAFSVKKRNTNILKPDKILSPKESLKRSAKIDSKTTQSQKLRRTRPSKASNIKISLVFPQQKQLTKPLLDRKQLQKHKSSVTDEILGERSEKSTKDGANEISGNKTVKVLASNTPLGIIQPSWRNITSTSPEQLITIYTHAGMASPSQLHRGTKLPSTVSDISNTKQTNCTTVSKWEMAETSLMRSDLLCSGLGRKSLPSSHIMDPNYSHQAKHVLPELNLAISTSSAKCNVVSYTGHEMKRPSPISRTQAYTYICGTGRKDRLVPSLVEKPTTTLMSWTKDARNADHHRNDASEVVSSSTILVDDYTRYRVNSPSPVEAKSKFYTESDYNELCDPDMKDTSRKEMSNEIEETENSEELKVCGIKNINMKEEDCYDFETIENQSTHSQRCTIV